MKTIRQWFESVKDEKLRNELLENLFDGSSDKKVNCLSSAIFNGFMWRKASKSRKYWINIHNKAFNNEIETL